MNTTSTARLLTRVGLCIVFCLMVIFLLPSVVFADGVVNDAYTYEDLFDTNDGLDATTQGFHNLGGYLEAGTTTAIAVSRCINLPQPTGGKFLEWAYLEIGVIDLGSTISNTLEIQSCDGVTITQTNQLVEGNNSVSLSAIPSANSTIRLRFTVVHAGQIGATIIPAKLDYWRVLGKAEGVTTVEVIPYTTTVDAGSTISFKVQVKSNGAKTYNPVLRFSLDKINGVNGLAQDAQIDYGNGGGLNTYHPLEFVSASNSNNGFTVEAQPGNAATTGEVLWNFKNTEGLAFLQDGFVDSVIVTLRVPKGYVDGKTLAARATMEYGVVSSLGDLNNKMLIESKDMPVTVHSINISEPRLDTIIGDVWLGATIRDQEWFWIRSMAFDTPSDIENVKVTIAGSETDSCHPIYRGVIVETFSPKYTAQILRQPAIGESLTPTNTIEVHFDRIRYLDISTMLRLNYDIPSNCVAESSYQFQARTEGGNLSWNNPVVGQVVHTVRQIAQRQGNNYTHRVMSGNEVKEYTPWPEWYEFYIPDGSLGAGQYFTTWSPYGNESNRTQTIKLAHTYILIEVPPGITFHGVRLPNGLTSIYKDCSLTAMLPISDTFNFGAPTTSGWLPVFMDSMSWSGPFSNTQDLAAPDAVVMPGCRLLGVKDNDMPPWQAPDFGYLSPLFLWRTCSQDSNFCTELPEGTPMALIPGTIYAYEEETNPNGIVHQTSYPGWTIYKEVKSWPKVYLLPTQDHVSSDQLVQLSLVPENDNRASEYVDGIWGINLYESRQFLKWEGITGEVLTNGFLIPKSGQNITGQSCDLNAIEFVRPDETACKAATDPGTSACFAGWKVPAACQPPNGWGYSYDSDGGHDNYQNIYHFRFNVPISATTKLGEPLNFKAEVRRYQKNPGSSSAILDLGANNMVSATRWSSGNYSASITVTVIDKPGFEVSATGPAAVWLGNSLTYTIKLQNRGSAPNPGLYIIDLLPHQAVSNSDFTPVYGAVFVSFPPEQVVVVKSEVKSSQKRDLKSPLKREQKVPFCKVKSVA